MSLNFKSTTAALMKGNVSLTLPWKVRPSASSSGWLVGRLVNCTMTLTALSPSASAPYCSMGWARMLGSREPLTTPEAAVGNAPTSSETLTTAATMTAVARPLTGNNDTLQGEDPGRVARSLEHRRRYFRLEISRAEIPHPGDHPHPRMGRLAC